MCSHFTGDHSPVTIATNVWRTLWFRTSALPPVKTSQKLVDDPEIHLEAHIIQQTFDELNKRFSAVHKQISHGLLLQCYKFNRLWNPIWFVFDEISLKLRSAQSSTSWRNNASTGLTPGRLDCQWWGNREANSCTQVSMYWSGEHGQSRKNIKLQFIMRQHYTPALTQYMTTRYAKRNKAV